MYYSLHREVFARYGPIYEISIIRDRATKSHKGMCVKRVVQ